MIILYWYILLFSIFTWLGTVAKISTSRCSSAENVGGIVGTTIYLVCVLFFMYNIYPIIQEM